MFSCTEISRPAVLQNIFWWLSMMTFIICLMHHAAHSAINYVSWGRVAIVKNQKRWQKVSLIFIYTMTDPPKNTNVYDEAIVGVYSRVFSKSFIDALLTQIRF